MKKFPVRKLACENGGEYVLGMKDLGTHACYLIYGELQPGESGREVCPGPGHEEILLAVRGSLRLSGAKLRGELPEGCTVHLRGEDRGTLANPGTTTAVYVIAGGHSKAGH